MNLTKTFELLSAMSDVRRFSLIRMAHPENVLEHTAFVSFLSIIMAMEINQRSPLLINIGRLAVKAVVHDMDETVTGDIPRPTKYHSKEVRDMFGQIESAGLDRIIVGLEVDGTIGDIIKEYHDRAKIGPEGLVIMIADTLAVVYKSWDEVVLRGNMSMVKVATYIIDEVWKLYQMVRDRFAGEAEVIVYLRGVLDEATRLATTASQKGKAA